VNSFESFFEPTEPSNNLPKRYLGKLESSDGRILDYNFGVEHKQDADPDDLSICGNCTSDLVYPVEWDEAGAAHWEVTMRCPNCEWSGSGVFEKQVVEKFDEVIDRGTEALVRDLKRMMHANFEDEIERFAVALEDDHLLPDDF
jgi:hypothetical protein